ncbi:MAG: YeeE/YedE family protein [Bdellovibrionales bacterium]|nr:YeeE/YedE family protein [Bdellovibrionales bacterium]
MDIVLAIIFGFLFGFILQRVGAADPDKILGMLTLRDLHLMRAIFMGIGVASVLLFVSLQVGFVDVGHISVKEMYSGVVVGGLLLGLGWAIAGFCPGTGVVALGAGRKDALTFLLGGLVGAGIYMYVFSFIKDSWLFESLFGGKATLAVTGNSTALLDAPWSAALAIIIGLAMIVVAVKLPERFRR